MLQATHELILEDLEVDLEVNFDVELEVKLEVKLGVTLGVDFSLMSLSLHDQHYD